MSLMWKLSIPLMLSASLFAASDKQIQEFVEKNIASNPSLSLGSVKVTGRQPVPGLKGWEAVQIQINAVVTRGGNTQEINAADMLFSNGDYIAPDLIHVSKGPLKQSMKGTMEPSDYKTDRIIAGDKSGKAPYKIAVFSDPRCPFCMDYVPTVIELAGKHPEKISLYYYHLPLASLHPQAPVIVRAAVALEMKGVKGVVEKLYDMEWDEKSNDEEKVLKALNKVFGSKLTGKEIHTPEVEAHIRADQELANRLMVQGTPTFFVNGVAGREEIERLKKELK